MINKWLKNLYFIICLVTITAIIIFSIVIANFRNRSYAVNDENQNEPKSTIDNDVKIAKQSYTKQLNLEEVAKQNENDIVTEKIERTETDVEFNTKYRENNSLPKGKMQTIQEGQDGKQNAIVKNVYKNGNIISSKLISNEITKAAIDKIVEVGTGSYANNYIPIVGDQLKVTSDTLALRLEPNKDSEKIITINKDEKVSFKKSQDTWYYVQYGSYLGWAESDCLTYEDPKKQTDGEDGNAELPKEQLLKNVNFSMLLNEKSGLSLAQFKKIFSDDKNDKNNVFKDNAEYFYYAEQQYDVNGIFVAAVGIHESGWGTSSISLAKKNLFGYQAYDRNPYENASSFGTYAEGIDLVSRVFAKYYINPSGKPIYGGEKAVATYYKGSTLTAVNTSYATDKNWANAVYKWMVYLYNKL